MKNNLLLAVTALVLFSCNFLAAQSYVGHMVDNYSGVHGLLLNPASVVDSRQRADINLFSLSAFGGSDYFSTDLTSIIESEEGFSFDENMDQNPMNDNQFFLNVDVLGPSIMFNLSPRSSIGLTSRVRAFMNFNNINGTLYENLEDGFDTDENFDFEMRNFSGTIHAWGEIGLTYGRILMDTERNFLKAGVTLKYLQGAGATFINTPNVSGQYDAANALLATTGRLSYGSTQGFDNDNIDFENLTSGFGADAGVVYEFRRAIDPEDLSIRRSDYLLKIGVSVTDVGKITYESTTVNSYDLNNTINTSDFEDKDLETVLEEEFTGTEDITDASISLPTAMHVLLDYNFKKHLYMSVHGTFSLVSDSKAQASRVINSVTATPRLEMRWLSLYLPVSIRQYDGLAMGAGLRLGPLTVGSGSIITNYISDSSQTADIYAGLKIPLYR